MANRIAITTGDPDGIGTEIASKALAKLGPHKNFIFYFWRSTQCPPKDLRRLDRHFKRITVKSWPEAMQIPRLSNKHIVDIASNSSAAKWVDISARACKSKYLDALVTGPLSKKSIVSAGFDVIGHTELLSQISGVNDLFMAFVGKKFSVLLATGHIPANEISDKLTTSVWDKAINNALLLRSWLVGKRSKYPVGIVGLNPHSGEDGLLGNAEKDLLIPLISERSSKKDPLVGPLVPDVAFQKPYWSKISVYVAAYHDQGLIPFKLVHGQRSGVHITMGLPFIRTSVDHGTAKDLFGKDKADYGSMLDAIRTATSLVSKQGVSYD